MTRKLNFIPYLVVLIFASGYCDEKNLRTNDLSELRAYARKPSKHKTARVDETFIEGKLTGQLGNQMFIIAAAVSLALDHDATPVFPDLQSIKIDNIPLNYEHIFQNLNTETPTNIIHQYHEPHYHYREIPYMKNMSIHGYFQSEKYFQAHKSKIIDLFSASQKIEMFLREKYSYILDNPKTVSIHLRCYLDHDPELKFYVQHGEAYCEEAIKQFPEDSIFVVFSNNMDYTKYELRNIDREMIFIEGETHYHDLYLMSKCRHNIICNSSFSWWAAYLNQNPEKIVIAPSRWFAPGANMNQQDIVPKEWRVIN